MSCCRHCGLILYPGKLGKNAVEARSVSGCLMYVQLSVHGVHLSVCHRAKIEEIVDKVRLVNWVVVCPSASVHLLSPRFASHHRVLQLSLLLSVR